MSKAICRGAMLSVGALATVSAADQGIEREFSVAAGGTLVVVADDAKLDVRGGGGTDTVRVAIRRGDDDAEAIEDDYDIPFDQSDNTLRVDVERRSSGLLGIFGNRRALSITVETPRAFGADLKTSGGGIAVANLSGSVAVETSGGALRFEDIDGDVDGRTSGGSIRLLGAASSVDLTTSGGSIAAETVRGPARMRTSGGKIAIDRAEGPLYAKTSGGSIEIKTALDAVEATTSGGSIAATFAGQPMDDSELVTSGGFDSGRHGARHRVRHRRRNGWRQRQTRRRDDFQRRVDAPIVERQHQWRRAETHTSYQRRFDQVAIAIGRGCRARHRRTWRGDIEFPGSYCRWRDRLRAVGA